MERKKRLESDGGDSTGTLLPKPLNRFLQIVKILWFIERLIHSDAKYAIAVLKVLRTIML